MSSSSDVTGTIDPTKFMEYVKLARLIVAEYSEVRTKYFTSMDIYFVFGAITPAKYREVYRKFAPILKEVGAKLGYYVEGYTERPYLYTIDNVLEHASQFEMSTVLVNRIGNYLKSIPRSNIDHTGEKTREFIREITHEVNIDYVFTPSTVATIYNNGDCSPTFLYMLTCIAMHKNTNIRDTTFTLREIFDVPIIYRQRGFVPFVVGIMKDFFAANMLMKIRSRPQ